MPVIEGIAQWASLSRPNDMSGKYQIDVTHLTDESVKQLQSDGVTSLHKETSVDGDGEPRGHYITLRANATNKNGDDLDPPQVVDAHKNPLPRGKRVGNGSRVKVVYDPFEWTFKKKSGVSAGLRVVQVLELEDYQGGSGLDDLEEEDGYVEETGVDELDDATTDEEEEESNLDDEIPF